MGRYLVFETAFLVNGRQAKKQNAFNEIHPIIDRMYIKSWRFPNEKEQLKSKEREIRASLHEEIAPILERMKMQTVFSKNLPIERLFVYIVPLEDKRGVGIQNNDVQKLSVIQEAIDYRNNAQKRNGKREPPKKERER